MGFTHIHHDGKHFVVFPFDYRNYTSFGNIDDLEKRLKRQIYGAVTEPQQIRNIKWIGLYPRHFDSLFSRCVEQVIGKPWAAAGGYGYFWDNPYGEYECESGQYAVGQLLKKNGVWWEAPDKLDLEWERGEDLPSTRELVSLPIAFVEVLNEVSE